MLDKKQLGLRIKELRKSKKITQEKLAEMIGVDFGYISKLELGQNYPSIPTLDKISHALNTDLSEFFTHSNDSEINVESEIFKIMSKFTSEEKKLLYRIAKSI